MVGCAGLLFRGLGLWCLYSTFCLILCFCGLVGCGVGCGGVWVVTLVVVVWFGGYLVSGASCWVCCGTVLVVAVAVGLGVLGLVCWLLFVVGLVVDGVMV